MLQFLMDEGKRNEIRRNVGWAMARLMELMHVKRILKIQPYVRSEREVQRVVGFMRGFPEMKMYPNLTNSDYRELSQGLSYREIPADTEVFDIQTEPTHVYFILHGQVNIEEKNPLIPDWDWARSQLKLIREWKASEFDPKVEKTIFKENAQQLMALKMQMRFQQVMKKKSSRRDLERNGRGAANEDKEAASLIMSPVAKKKSLITMFSDRFLAIEK